jgi:hypothetical protein
LVQKDWKIGKNGPFEVSRIGKSVAFLGLQRIKWKRPTMATLKLGKNLRLNNQNEKPAAVSKSQAAPVSPFAACASIGEIKRKE